MVNHISYTIVYFYVLCFFLCVFPSPSVLYHMDPCVRKFNKYDNDDDDDDHEEMSDDPGWLVISEHRMKPA